MLQFQNKAGKDPASVFDEVKELDELNPILSNLEMRAGWNKKEPSLWKEPRDNFRAMHWQWEVAQKGLSIAGGMISTELTDRRNLFLVNPKGDHYATLRTLVCAYQMIMPGERARSHRHSPHALRLALDVGKNVYTVVDGERVDMAPNDVVLTPGGSWHGHANDGTEDAYWIDFLDVPLVHLLEPMFLEHWPAGFQEPTTENQTKSLVCAWKDISRQLDQQLQAEKGKSSVSVVLDAPMVPTVEMLMTTILAGKKTDRTRSTNNQIIAVVSGSGSTEVGGQVFNWKRGDVMAIPCWAPVRHSAHEQATLFNVSDARAQKLLGYFRSEVLGNQD